ncbi:MAG: hypothetical protein HZA53_14145 [Planctomycetes bacterium]|nr:hypothetical protein [Planctomycetota bacterium]
MIDLIRLLYCLPLLLLALPAMWIAQALLALARPLGSLFAMGMLASRLGAWFVHPDRSIPAIVSRSNAATEQLRLGGLCNPAR